MSDDHVPGPIDIVLIEFPAASFPGQTGEALWDLVERGVVAIYDLLVVRKEADGSVTGLAVEDVDADHIGGFAVFAGARTGLLADSDVTDAGAALEVGTVAVLIAYENLWAVPFVTAALDAGGSMVASVRIPVQDVIDVLDALDTES